MTFAQMAPTNCPDTYSKKKPKYNYLVPSSKNSAVLNFRLPNFGTLKEQPPLLNNGENTTRENNSSARKQRSAANSTTNGAYAGAKFNDPPPPNSLPPPPDRWLEDLVKVTPVEKSCCELTSQLKTLLNIEKN